MANYITNVTIDGTQANIKDAETSNNLTAHINADNPHHISKATIGLGNVDNTSDGDKSVKDAKALSHAYNYRPGTANATYGDAKLRYFLATNVMTEGQPDYAAGILHLAWDNNNGYDQQIAMLCAPHYHMQFRSQNKGTWSDWMTVLDSSNFKDYALNQVYPVGSIYMSVNSVDPATLFGGTWSRIEENNLGDTGINMWKRTA